VAACREAFAFEDSFETADGKTKCWVTLLPFSATGTWIDYVYGFVSLDPAPGAALVQEPEEPAEAEAVAEPDPEPQPVEDELAEAAPEPVAEIEPEQLEEPEVAMELDEPVEIEPEPAPANPAESTGKAGFSKKFFESLASGFYGRPAEVELDLDTARLEAGEPEEPVAVAEPSKEEPAAAEERAAIEDVLAMADEQLATEEPAASDEPIEPEPSIEPVSTSEGTLQSKLTEVRARADEARQAKLRANTALYEGLSAAYDFALDAEDAPEEYLRLVEAQGLKIQLRSPMKPVVKLAFDGMCDDATIKQLEAILAWAFNEELPRGTLAERIEAEGGIAPILSGQKRAA
jgi:hypothetical protein